MVSGSCGFLGFPKSRPWNLNHRGPGTNLSLAGGLEGSKHMVSGSMFVNNEENDNIQIQANKPTYS